MHPSGKCSSEEATLAIPQRNVAIQKWQKGIWFFLRILASKMRRPKYFRTKFSCFLTKNDYAHLKADWTSWKKRHFWKSTQMCFGTHLLLVKKLKALRNPKRSFALFEIVVVLVATSTKTKRLWKSRLVYMDVSENRGTPKSSILIGFSIINHPFWGIYPYFWISTHIGILIIGLWTKSYITG